MDFLLKIIKENDIYFYEGDNVYYDNIIWFELNDFIDNNIANTKLRKIEKNKIKGSKIDCEIDFINQIIKIPFLPIYKSLDEFKKSSYSELEFKDNYIIYPDGNKFEIKNVIFEEENILFKNVLSFYEFKKLFNFLKSCIDSNDVDFLVNKNLFLRLNEA